MPRPATTTPQPTSPQLSAPPLTGSKGLSGGYVFIVGFNDGHFPRDPSAIKDQEVCQFLVGLSRTRKACHVVSAGRLGAEVLRRSRFARWIADYLEPSRSIRPTSKSREPRVHRGSR